MGEQSGGFWQKNNIWNKNGQKKWQKTSPAAHPYSTRMLLRRSSHMCKANHFQRIPQQRSTTGPNPAFLLFQEHQVFFGHRAPQTALTSLFLLLMFYIQFTPLLFFPASALREETALLASSQPSFTLCRPCIDHLTKMRTDELV